MSDLKTPELYLRLTRSEIDVVRKALASLAMHYEELVREATHHQWAEAQSADAWSRRVEETDALATKINQQTRVTRDADDEDTLYHEYVESATRNNAIPLPRESWKLFKGA